MAKITLDDVSLREYTLDDFERLRRLQDIHFRTTPEICTERPYLVTKYMKEMDNPNDMPVLRQAKTLRFLLEKKKPIIRHTTGKVCHYTDDGDPDIQNFVFYEDNLLTGSTTSKAKGVILYPEFLALSIWPELLTIKKRKKNPYYISDEDIEKLNYEVFPFWPDKTILEYTRRKFNEPFCQKVMQKLVFFLCSKPYCISHTIPAYWKVIDKGLNSIIREAEEKKEEHKADEEKRTFYEALKIALEGVIAYSHNLSTEAMRLAASETGPDRRRELKRIGDICAKVPAEKPDTFEEGLNAIWICKTALHQENANIGFSIGRLDQILYDLYRQDIDSGRLTVKDAIELVGCFWLKCADHVPMVPEAAEELFGGTGSNQAITLGGITPDGANAVNDLTYVMLKATELMKVRDPNVNARIHIDNPPEYLRRLCEVNIETRATPSMHNDLAAISTLVNQGIALEHARDYSSVGCVEPSGGGRAYAHSGSVLLNLVSALNLTLFNGKYRPTDNEQIGPNVGESTKLKTFNDFMNAFETQLKWLIQQSVEMNNYLGRAHQALHPTPLLSALFEGPMDKGKDLIEGGALYNSSGVSITGFSDVVDSISAIEAIVYGNGTASEQISMDKLLKAMESDFTGEYKSLGMMLRNRAPKFGTENPIADKNARRITEFLHNTYQSYTNYRGGKYTVGYWTMTMHAGFGMLTGATPNGRKAGQSFSSGITPVSGATKSLTACLNSVADLDSQFMANGIALNLKYMPDSDIDLTLGIFNDTVKTYFEKGGLQVQFNIIAHKELLEALKDPENQEYRNLLVRVSGYTAYFYFLNDQMKREIINRSEYNLKTKEAVPYEWV